MAGIVDWNALAAEVQANYAATGQWFASGAPPRPEPVEWNALAARVLANFAATGQWFLGEIGDGQHGGPGPAVTRANTSAAGEQANGVSHGASLSADGTRIAFSSGSTNLVPNDTNGLEDIFVKDLATGEIRLVPGDTNWQSDVFVRGLGGAFANGPPAPPEAAAAAPSMADLFPLG